MQCTKCDGFGGYNVIVGMDNDGHPIFAANECPWCHGTGVVTPAWEKYIPKDKKHESN